MKKEIVKYLNNGMYAIMLPVYYDYEENPAWRKVFVGTEIECKNRIDSFPDSIQATMEENKINRMNKVKEYQLMLELGKKKVAKEIKIQYNL